MLQLQQKYQVTSLSRDGSLMMGVSRKDGKQVAIKKISFGSMTERDKKSITEEVNLLRSVKSNNIVRYENYIIDRNEACLYVIMEYCSQGSLEDLLDLKRKQGALLEEKAIWKIFSEIVSAVDIIHSDPKGAILHRDIKPKNILLDKDNNVKLGNFSLLKRLDPEQEFAMTKIQGTLYSSPEQLKQGIYTTQSDIWALGCLLYEMTTLKSPFRKGSEFLTAQSIQFDRVESIPCHYSEELRRVINWCLMKQREMRPTAAMLKGAPEISYRLRKARLLEYTRSIEEKREKLQRRQTSILEMQSRIRELEALHYLQEDKENLSSGNFVGSIGFGSKF